MKTKIFSLVVCICCSTLFTHAQTNVSGGIFSNTTWTLANSPYIVTGDIVLFPGKTLTIEPGVQVRFDGNFSLEIRGKLIAIGTATDSIRFISNTSPIKSAWEKISILNASQNACGFFEFCVLKHSRLGINVECCWGNDSTYIKNSLFDNNLIASSYYAGWYLPIDNCVFTNNTIAVDRADKTIRNSTFINNRMGIFCGRFEARNCIFQYNDSAIYWSGSSSSGIIDSCTIINNNIGIRSMGGTITNNIIKNNNYGLITGHPSYTINGIEYYVPIKKNQICDNLVYNVENTNNYNKNITENCFCLSDSIALEGKLKDGYDDITLGLFNYDVYDSTCQVVTRSVYKIGNPPSSILYIHSKNPNVLIYPNPFTEQAILQTDITLNNATMTVLNYFGQTVKQRSSINGQTIMINRNDLPSGLYFIRLTEGNNIIANRKFVISD